MPLSVDINWSDKKNMKEAKIDMMINMIYHFKLQKNFMKVE